MGSAVRYRGAAARHLSPDMQELIRDRDAAQRVRTSALSTPGEQTVNLIAQHRLERRLAEHGRAAQAEVLDSRRSVLADRDRAGRLRQLKWRMTLRVRPEGLPAFDVRFSQWLPPSYEPVAGQVFEVLYDPANHDQVIVDPRAESPAAKAMAVMRSAGDSVQEWIRDRGDGQVTGVARAEPGEAR